MMLEDERRGKPPLKTSSAASADSSSTGTHEWQQQVSKDECLRAALQRETPAELKRRNKRLPAGSGRSQTTFVQEDEGEDEDEEEDEDEGSDGTEETSAATGPPVDRLVNRSGI